MGHWRVLKRLNFPRGGVGWVTGGLLCFAGYYIVRALIASDLSYALTYGTIALPLLVVGIGLWLRHSWARWSTVALLAALWISSLYRLVFVQFTLIGLFSIFAMGYFAWWLWREGGLGSPYLIPSGEEYEDDEEEPPFEGAPPTLGTMTLRDWTFEVEEATLKGFLHVVDPGNPVSETGGRWLPDARYGKQASEPLEWRVHWSLEIHSKPQRDREDPDGMGWGPYLGADLFVPISDWRTLDGQRVEIPGKQGEDRWEFTGREPCIHVFDNYAVTDNVLTFEYRKDAIFHLHWTGQAAMNWSETWSMETPFRVEADTELRFEGVGVMCCEGELHSARTALYRLINTDALKEMPLQVTEHSPRIRKMTGVRRMIRVDYRPRI